MEKFELRLKNVQKVLGRKHIDAVYISSIRNIRYLTGFTGSSGFVLITKDKGLFFTDFRYKEQAGIEVRGYERGLESGRRMQALHTLVKKLGIKKLGFEASVAYEFFELLKGLPANLEPQVNLIENLRKIKDKEEISSTKEAALRAEQAFLDIKPKIRVGAREREIALRLEEQLKKGGCRSIPFDIIVASGKNSAMPHAQPTERKIEKGDFVIIDWGGEAQGYFSDMTRTLLMAGNSLSEKITIYNVVNKARRLAIESVKKGVKTSGIDGVARDTITRAGYGEYFGHGTGHGVGLDVHEAPRLSRVKGEPVRSGMVFTVEPGIYVPGLGGVRIEDMVAVQEDRVLLLTTLSRELEIIK